MTPDTFMDTFTLVMNSLEKRLLLKLGPGPWSLDSDPEKPGLRRTWTLKNMGNDWIWKNDWKTTYYNLLTLNVPIPDKVKKGLHKTF